MAVVLALTACAVPPGATSLLAVGEWIADAPAHVLHRLGVGSEPLQPRRTLPSETMVRRLPARIDGDALDQAIGSRLTDRRPEPTGLRGLSVDGKSLRGAAKARGPRPEDPSARRPGAHHRPGPRSAGRRREESSSRGEFRPPALTEPCVKISLYTALAILITSPRTLRWSPSTGRTCGDTASRSPPSSQGPCATPRAACTSYGSIAPSRR